MRNKKIITTSVIVAVCSLSGVSHGQTILSPIADATIDRGNTARGTENTIIAKYNSAGISGADRIILWSYDLTGVTSVGDATLTFNIVNSQSGAGDFNVYGVPNGFADETFDQATLDDFNDSLTPNDGAALGFYLDESLVTSLGSFSVAADAESATFSSAALVSFLQADNNNIASFVLAKSNIDGSNSLELYATEHSSQDPILLSVTAATIPEASSVAQVASIAGIALCSATRFSRRRKRILK